MNTLLIFWPIGIIACFLFYFLIAKRFLISKTKCFFYCLFILICEIFGAKILFILENLTRLSYTQFSIISGFSLFGVFLITPIIMGIFFLNKRNEFVKFMDFFSLGIFPELLFYRINCYVVGCCGGIILNGFKVPTQLIEIFFDAVIFLLGIFVLNKHIYEGYITGLSYCSYGVVRFILEFLRERENVFSIFSVSHFLSLVTIIIGISFIFFGKKRQRFLPSHEFVKYYNLI